MSCFRNAFVFTNEPRWERLSKLPSGLALRGYAHSEHPVWLLDFWKPSPDAHTPFAAPLYEGLWNLHEIERHSGRQLRTFIELAGCLQRWHSAYGASQLQLTLYMSLLLGEAFYFAGKDAGIDIAISAKGGALEMLGAWFDPYVVAYVNGEFLATPCGHVDPRSLQAARTVSGVRISQPLVAEGVKQHFGMALEMWPIGAGDPVEMLGIGTREPFSNLADDYRVVFTGGAPA